MWLVVLLPMKQLWVTEHTVSAGVMACRANRQSLEIPAGLVQFGERQLYPNPGSCWLFMNFPDRHFLEEAG